MASKRRGAGRPPGGSEHIIRGVLEITVSQLGEKGYERLSIEEIASAAGVHKTSIYRRWPTKAELVFSAIHGTRLSEPRFVESGDLQKDLVALLSVKAKRLSTTRGRTISRALITLESDEKIATSLRAARFGLSTALLRGAIERGQLPPNLDVEFASEVLFAPILHRVLLLSDRAPRSFIEDVVTHALIGFGYRKRGRRAVSQR